MKEELASFSLAFLASAVFISLPYILLEIKGIPITERVPAQRIAVELGAINTAFMLSRTLGSWKPKRGPSVFLLLIGTIGVALSNNIAELILSRALQGLASGMIWPTIEASAANKGVRGLVRINISSNLGFSLGSIFSGFVLSFPQEPVLLVAPLSLVPLLVKEIKIEKKDLLSKRAINLLYLTAFINGLALGMRGPIFTSYFLQYVTSSPREFSFTWGIPSLVILINYILAIRIDRLNTERKLFVSSVLKAIQSLSIALVAFTTNVYIILLLLTLGRLGATLSVSVSKAAQAELGSSVKEFGRRQSFFSLGNSIGPALGGLTYKVFYALGAANLSLLVVAFLSLISSLTLLKTSKVVGS